MNIVSSLILSIFLIGCSSIPYEESKVEIISINQSIRDGGHEDETFNQFLLSNNFKQNEIPIKSWGVKEILLAQYFFNYDIKAAKKSIDWIRENEKIALLKPESSLGIEIGKTDSNDELSKNIFGSGFNFTFERTNKRLIRHEIAFNETQYALLSYEKKLWESRTLLLKKVVEYAERQDFIKITKKELLLKHSILQMIKKRVSLGVSSQIDFDRIALELKSINQNLISLQYQQANLKKEIATSVGLSLEKFNLIPINVESVKELFNKASRNFLNGKKISEIQYKATTNSRDLRIFLADYAIAESELKYEIAKQYPDFNFSPAYTYDMGNYVWNIGIDMVLGSKNRNIIFINKAKKLRSVKGSKVLAYQLKIINEAENLLGEFKHSLELKNDNEKILETKNKLEKKLKKRFDNGILDRLELELEIIKLNEFDRDYHEAYYNVIKKGLDAELIVQEPIFTEKFI